jgi:MFS transporter, DHA2 family, multidrug resistance protein
MTPFLQNLLGYPILTAGYILGGRGIGTFFAMMAVGRLLKLIEARNLIFVGLVLTAGTLYHMTGFTMDTPAQTIVVTSVVQGVGLGFVFVPISTVAFASLEPHLRTSGTAILTLVRNIGSSVGISMVIAELTNKTTIIYARLAEYVTPFNQPLQAPDVAANLDLNTDMGRALLDQMMNQQASMVAFANVFWLLMVLTLLTLPLLLIIGTSKSAKRSPSRPVEAHAALD